MAAGAALSRPRYRRSSPPGAVQQALQQTDGHGRPQHLRQPSTQGVETARRWQCAPGSHVQRVTLAQRRQVQRGDFVGQARGVLRVAGRHRQRGLCVGEGCRERRPHGVAQRVARKAWVGVAAVVDVAQPVPAHVGLDGLARLLQPGSHPAQALSKGLARHRRKAAWPTAAQRLQQPGLGLVAPVVGHQHQRAIGRSGHLAQGTVALAARPGFDAFARGGMAIEPARVEGRAPAPCLLAHLALPVVGSRLQAVVHVQGDHLNAQRGSGLQRRMQQRRRIAAAAGGHRDPAPGHQRSLVSEKRP